MNTRNQSKSKSIEQIAHELENTFLFNGKLQCPNIIKKNKLSYN